ncbi:MAG: helix-turn-helix domain-containing protein [Ruminococcaceae bacterium]|nr:helix-turn-helix domain-containing protein [Oscillospiraceae bacterium]
MSNNMITAERLKQCRIKAKQTLEQIGNLTGVHKTTVMRWEKGETERIGLPTIQALATYYRVNPAWLMGADVPMDPSATIPTGFSPVPDTVKRPRLGKISCGVPIMSEENFDGYDEVPKHIDCDFTLVCDGDSMTGARILDGDIVYIKQQPMVENGEIAAVLVDGCEKLLKRVYITETSITLQAENPKYSPLIFIREDMNRVSIIGKAVAFMSVVR